MKLIFTLTAASADHKMPRQSLEGRLRLNALENTGR